MRMIEFVLQQMQTYPAATAVITLLAMAIAGRAILWTKERDWAWYWAMSIIIKEGERLALVGELRRADNLALEELHKVERSLGLTGENLLSSRFRRLTLASEFLAARPYSRDQNLLQFCERDNPVFRALVSTGEREIIEASLEDVDELTQLETRGCIFHSLLRTRELPKQPEWLRED